MKKMLFLFAFVSAFAFPFPAFSQSFEDAFQSMGNNGCFRYLGVVGVGINIAGFHLFCADRYANSNFALADGYSEVIKGSIIYTSNVIDVPAEIKTAMEDKINAVARQAGKMYEFIFPYEKERYSKGYLLVILYLYETWGTFDLAQAWFIRTN
jgi:hypothetical protein